MNGDSFSLKARRTTRIPLRIPIVLVYRDGEKDRNLDAWTLIVNVNGARVEVKHLFAEGDEVTLRVPHLSKSQKGTIVWRDANANKNGGYECGIKLEKPENLWGVGFPPTDWTARASGIDDLLPSKTSTAAEPAAKAEPLKKPIGPVAAVEMEPKSVMAEKHEPAPVETSKVCPPEMQSKILPVVPVEPETQGIKTDPVPETALAEFPILMEEAASMENPSGEQEPMGTGPGVDLTAELNAPRETLTANATEVLLKKETLAPAEAVESRTDENESVQEDRETKELPKTEEPGREAGGLGVPQALVSQASLKVQSPPKAQPLRTTPSGGTDTASDRLSTIFHELVETALEQRVQGLVEGMAARMEGRIAEIEAAAMSQLEQRVTGLVESQSEGMKDRALEITSSRQAALEQSVREYLEAQEQAALSSQQEMIQETSRTAYEEMSQTAARGTQRMMEQAEEIQSATRTNLWQSVQQELPTLEQEVFTRARTKGEEAATACFDEMNRRLPERMKQAELSMNQQIDGVIGERMSQFDARLMERSQQLQEETKARVEQQIQEVWKQTNQAFLRHIVGELNQKKQAWLEEVEGNMKEASNQNLAWIQRRMTQTLKNLGESLIERAGEMDCGLEPSATRESNVEQEMIQLAEAHSGD